MNYFCFLQWWLQVRHFLKQNKKSQTQFTKTKTKVYVKGKKVFLSFPTIIPSSTFSERLLIFVLHRWSMIGMHSQAEAYTLHYSTLSPLCPILSFFIIFFTLRPLFFYTFTLFYSAPYFFLMCALLFYIFALRPTLFIGPESDHWLCLSLTHWLTDSLTHWLPFSKLDWCDPGMWRWQLKTCWSLLGNV